MKVPKLALGFAMTLFMFMAISVSAVQSKSGGHRILKPEEAVMVRGGLVSPGGGGGGKWGSSGSGGSGSSTASPIILNNIPYVSQTTNSPRSQYYCGIACALMVRAKNPKGTSNAPTINQSTAQSILEQIDRALDDGYYAGNKVNVWANKGLLYISPNYESNEIQYNKSTAVLRSLYTAKNSDNVFYENGHVSGVTFNILHTDSDAATNAIWNHINNNRQPVIIVIDSNVMDYVQQNGTAPPDNSRLVPFLHYVVVRGIKNTGRRIFSIYDPGAFNPNLQIREYSESELRILMSLPRNTSAWVYQYPSRSLGISDPGYVLSVQGD
jgi:hypothetical protein